MSLDGWFHQKLSQCSVLMAELRGIHIAHSLAWQAGYRRVVFESDSGVVVHLIQQGCGLNHPYGTVLATIIELFNHDEK